MSLQQGGRILGEGAYGCVFDKPLVCKRKRRAHKHAESEQQVGKITFPDMATHELSISSTLAAIPDAKQYFSILSDACDPAPRKRQTEEDLDDCKLLETKPIQTMVQLTMPFGGRPLERIPLRATSIDFFRFGQHLLEAGTLLLMSGVVHFDLHRNNVLLYNRWKSMIIDFGMSWRPSQVTLANIEQFERKGFSAKYNQEAPEVSFVIGLQNGVDETTAMKTIIGEKGPLQMYRILFGVTEDVMLSAFQRYIQGSWSIRNRHWYSFYTLYWSKFDAWAIGYCLLSVYYDLLQDRDFVNQPSFRETRAIYERAIRKLCWVDPAERYDCAEALSLWNPSSPILDRIDVVEWLQTKRDERQALQSLQHPEVLEQNPT